MKQKRKICFITGTRADFGILTPVMRKVKSSKKLELFIIATGMHLEKKFGYTISEIEKEGFSIYKEINTSYSGDSGKDMAKSVGSAIIGFAEAFSQLKPDIVVVLGDRGEMLAGAIAANYLQIPVAHIHGGEISGHVDGIIRHAITKLSHIHFASTENAKQRIIKLGEEAGKVYISGAPALDRIKGEKLPGKTELFKKYGFDEKKQLFLIVQHPDSSEKENAASKIKETIKAVLSFKAQTLMVYPNSDAGGRQMIDIIEGYKKSLFLTFAKSISHLDYLGFLQIADLLVGNSSSGIIEAPSFNIPVVNIGSRQEDREHASNVFNVGYDKEKIVLAVKNALKYGTMAKKSGDRIINPYGEGDASRKIVSVLEKVPLGRDLLLKRITY